MNHARRTGAIAAVLAVLGYAVVLPGGAGATGSPSALAGLGRLTSSLVTLGGSLPAILSSAVRLGAAPADTPARALISLRQRDLAGLQRFIAAVSDPRSRLYGHYLTPAQYVARFAPTQSAVQAVEAYASAAGFTVAEVPANRAYVYVKGTVAAAERAFGVRIENLQVGSQLFRAPVSALRIPSSLAGVVTAVKGLDTSDRVIPNASPPAAYVSAPPCASYFGGLTSSAPPVYGAKTSPPVVTCGY
jgi:subtilase family serine protease